MANAVTVDLVIDALRTKLLTGAFATEVGSRVHYYEAPRSETLPYCVFFIVDNTPEHDTFDRNSFRMRVQISVHDSEANGPRALGDIIDDLRALLHRVVLAVAGHECLPLDLDMERGPMKEGDVWVCHADYILAGWKT